MSRLGVGVRGAFLGLMAGLLGAHQDPALVAGSRVISAPGLFVSRPRRYHHGGVTQLSSRTLHNRARAKAARAMRRRQVMRGGR